MTSEEIKAAMTAGKPVIYDGIEYLRITAYIYRVGKDAHSGRYRSFLQVELLDKCKHAVIIAEPEKVTLKED